MTAEPLIEIAQVHKRFGARVVLETYPQLARLLATLLCRAYGVDLVNRRGAGTAHFDVALTYGGALSRQLFLTQVANANGTSSSYFLPLQYIPTGKDSNNSADDWVWRDYRSSDWYDHTTGSFKTIAKTASFDASCAGCHFTGFSVTGDATSGFSARAVAEFNGDFDFDGDGEPEIFFRGGESPVQKSSMLS